MLLMMRKRSIPPTSATVFDVSCLEPFRENALLHWDVGQEPLKRVSVEAGADIPFKNPLRPVVSTECDEAGFNRICRRATSPKSVGVRVSRCLSDRIESQQVQGLH